MIDFVPKDKIYKPLLIYLLMTNNEELIKNKTVISPRTISILKDVSNKYASLILKRYTEKNYLRRIKKGKYTSSYNIYAVASNLIYPSYISFWSGIRYYGKTEQLLNTIFVACTKKTRDIKFENYKIKFVKLSKKYFFGFKKEISTNEEVFIADKEKLLLDCLLFQKYSGNIDEIIKFIEGENFDIEKLKIYLKKINNQSLIQKTAFLLEKYKKIDLGLKIKTRNYTFLPIIDKEKINKKWRVKTK
ncbi:hypothetical protein GYA25_01970 [Candidatus Woesearchaeota archaeon]|nr:hypothetical protein [Candidatus Woesearchaeota archaeon]